MNINEAFRNCIKSAAQSRTLDYKDISVLQSIVETYPWFITARTLYDTAAGAGDPLAELHYSAYGRPFQSLADVSAEEFENHAAAPKSAEPQPVKENLIEKFLQKGEYRIIPDETTPDEDQAAGCGDFDLSDDFVSEELAQIYLAQGLNTQAKKIYERLSLLNPEKSIYFAEIIEGFNSKPANGKNL